MITLEEIKQKFSQCDWGYFQSIGMPDVALLIRSSTDFGFVESMAQNPENNNDPLVKAAANYGSRLISAIPGVGEIMSLVFGGVGIDLSIFGAVSDSATAKDRLGQWAHAMDGSSGSPQIYPSGGDYITNDNVYPYNMQFTFSKADTDLFNARPKCTAPTEGCTLEHRRYILRTHIQRESQEATIKLYLDYINHQNFNEFIQKFNPKLTGQVQNPGSSVVPKMNPALGLALLGLITTFKK